MSGQNDRCGLCKAEIGFGPGFRTGICINNVRVVLMPTDPQYVRLRYTPVKATVIFCLPCLENIVENLITKDIHGKTELDQRDVKTRPIQLVIDPKKKH